MTRSISMAAMLLAVLAAGAAAQDLQVDLDFFTPLSGTEWTGHYVGSEDSNLVHYIRWDPILNWTAVRATKRVPELDFLMETYVFLDLQGGGIAFLSLNSRGGLGRGKVSVSGNEILYSGKSYFAGGSVEFKQTFEVLESGLLRDRFYRKTEEGSWVQGHLIEYRPAVDERGSE